MANQIKANLARLLFSAKTINSGEWGRANFEAIPRKLVQERPLPLK
jgi:hypothetical protein